MQFTDKMVTCEQCGSQFVFTVTKQREMVERGVELIEPKFCPRCSAAVEEPGIKLTCEQCGSQFMFTATEQRGMAERGAELFEPKFCPRCRAVEEPGAKLIGQVKWFDAVKGWGFITKASGEDIFVHHSNIEGRGTLQDGQKVEFLVEQGPKGPAAVEVAPLPTE